MSLYDLEEPSNIYGYTDGKLSNQIEYLLHKVQIQDDPSKTMSYMNDVSKMDGEMKTTIKSKYNLFKHNEPQSVDGSGNKKRFRFSRK